MVPRDINPSSHFFRSDQQIIDEANQEKERFTQAQHLETITKDEQATLLKSLLREVGVTSTWKWDDAYRNIREDHRYKFLKMPMADKKHLFSDYMSEQRQRERDQQALKKERQRELFRALLDENKDALGLNGLSKYYKVCDRLAKRDYKRFSAVDERDRKEFFQDYVEDLFDKEMEKRQEMQRGQIERVTELLAENLDSEEQGWINSETRWQEANDRLKDSQVWKAAG